jgi:spermidine/putrescine ABC transporter ATP-binding subunit
MNRVEAIDVVKRFGKFVALDGVTVTFREGELFGLLGPSGSGKTTLLRMIAGFLQPESGVIRIGGDNVAAVPVHRRDIGMVFQNYALFPHLSVYDNVAFGMTTRRMPSREIRRRVDEMLELVHLNGLESRKPAQLSGGQQQRVALARALVTRPRVLLLDEPLAALDRRLRQQMQTELRQIQKLVGLTTIFVTHDQEEALTLSDRIGIFEHGRILQEGTPSEVYERPVNRFAASFLGDANFLSGHVNDRGQVEVASIGLIAFQGAAPVQQGAVVIAIRPEKVTLLDEGAPSVSGRNRLSAKIESAVFSGSSTSYRLHLADGGPFIVFVQNIGGQPHDVGSCVTLDWSADATVVLAA